MRRHFCLYALGLALVTSATAQSADAERNLIGHVLTALDRHGLNLALQLYSDTLAGSPGAAATAHATSFQFVDLSADIHLGRFTRSLHHSDLYVSFHLNGNRNADFDTTYQSMVGITSPAGARIAEFYLQQDLGPDTRLKLGKIDANPDFAFVTVASGFMNSSFSYDPTFITLPNYSNTGWGSEFLWRHRYAHLHLAAFDPLQGTGTLLMQEAGLDWQPSGWNGRITLGSWQQTGQMPAFSGPRQGGARGYYVVTEQKIWRHLPRNSGTEQSLSAFVQLGSAPAAFSNFTRHLGAGIVWSAPLATRPADSAGFAVTRARFTSDRSPAFDRKHETVLELYYTLRLNACLSLSPDLQFAINPGGVSTNHNALAAGARIMLSLNAHSE